MSRYSSLFAQALESALFKGEPHSPYDFDPAAQLPTLKEFDMKEMSQVMREFLGGRCGNIFSNGRIRRQGFFRLIVNGAGPVEDPMRFILFRTDFKDQMFDEIKLCLLDGRDIQVYENGKIVPLLINKALVGILLLTDAEKCQFADKQFALLVEANPDFDGPAPYDYFVEALSAK